MNTAVFRLFNGNKNIFRKYLANEVLSIIYVNVSNIYIIKLERKIK
jgi:hypothetical protein